MGEALRLLRIFNGYKSAELAQMLGISQSYVSELENNKKQPTMEVLDKYATVFGMKKSTLFLFAESLEKDSANKKSVDFYLRNLWKKINRIRIKNNE